MRTPLLLLALASCVVVHVHEAPRSAAVESTGSASFAPGRGDLRGTWIPSGSGSDGACTLNATGWSSGCWQAVPDEFIHGEDNMPMVGVPPEGSGGAP